MKELIIGTINQSQLADWFNISEVTLKKRKSQKLEILKEYCNFKIINSTTIEVLEIYKKTYIDSRYKYQINEPLGPYNTILLERVRKSNHSYGKFKCSFCGNEFLSRIDVVVNGTTQSCGCQLKQKYLDMRINYTGQRFGKLVAIKDIGTKYNSRLWLCKCDCGRTTVVNSSNWKNIFSCGHCNLSKGEDKIEEILQNNSINFERQKTFDTCRNKELLRFDFYLPDYNVLIEYDGIQHFQYNEKSGWNTEENFKKTKNNDNIKNQWCKDNNIPLIRIPYTHFDKLNINDLILKTTNFQVV